MGTHITYPLTAVAVMVVVITSQAVHRFNLRKLQATEETEETYTSNGTIVYGELNSYAQNYSLAQFTASVEDWGLAPMGDFGRRFALAFIKIPWDVLQDVFQGKPIPKVINPLIKSQGVTLTVVLLGVVGGILLPLGGCCFCCCRLRGKCGGKLQVRDAEKQSSLSCLLMLSIVLSISLILLIHGAFLFADVKRMGTTFPHFQETLNYALDDGIIYKDEILMQIDQIVGDDLQFMADSMLRDLDNLTDFILPDFLAGLHDPTDRLIQQLTATDQLVTSLGTTFDVNIEAATAELINMNVELTADLGNLTANLTAMKAECDGDSTLFNAGLCTNLPTAADVPTVFDFSQTPDLSNQEQYLTDAKAIGISGVINTIQKTIADIPEMVNNDTKPVTQGLRSMITGLINTVDSGLSPMRSALKNMTNDMERLRTDMNTGFTQIKPATDHILKIGTAAGALIMLVVLTPLWLGLLGGLLGCKLNRRPEKRSSLSNAGRHCLMTSVCCTWLPATICLIVGGIVFFLGSQFVLVCEALEDFSLFTKLIDNPVYFNGEYVLGREFLQKPTHPLTFHKILSDCRNNRALYTALDLEYRFNLTEILDINQHLNMSDLDGVSSSARDAVKGVELVSNNTLSSITDLINSNNTDINPASLLADMRNGLSDMNFTDLLQTINTAASQLQPHSPDLANQYTQIGAFVQDLQTTKKDAFNTSLNNLEANIDSLREILQNTKPRIQNVLTEVIATEQYIMGPGANALVTAVPAYISRMLGYVSGYLQHITTRLRNDFGRCHYIWDLYDGLILNSLCTYFLDAFNGLWLFMCTCGFFMVLSIIFTVRLAKYFRRPDDANIFNQFSSIKDERQPKAGPAKKKGKQYKP